MRLNGHRRTRTKLEGCLVFDSSVAEILPGEAVPLLKHSSVPLSRHSFEMAPVHMSNHRVATSDTVWVTSRTSPPIGTRSSYFQTPTRGRFCISIRLMCWQRLHLCLVVNSYNLLCRKGSAPGTFTATINTAPVVMYHCTSVPYVSVTISQL